MKLKSVYCIRGDSPNDYYPKAISRIQYKLKALSDESEVQEQSQNS
jgi:hypothetical protein